MIDFKKDYTQEEYDLRRSIFESRVTDIKEHNTRGTSSYRKVRPHRSPIILYDYQGESLIPSSRHLLNVIGREPLD